VCPLTTSVKRPYPQQVPVVYNHQVSIVLGDQITSIPTSELDKYICSLCDFQMDQIDRAIAVQLGLTGVESKSYTPCPKTEGE
jgi:mRNA-degrading endonuclease toxin of MazEF toxin-antitoxin module